MQEAVYALYATNTSVQHDTQATRWLHEASNVLHVTGSGERDRITAILSLAFFAQVRHNFLSNQVVAHIARWHYILRPGPTSVGQALRVMLMNSGTSLQWVPMVGRRFDLLSQHIDVHRIMHSFYTGLGSTEAFARSIQHPLALPSEMVCSTGV